MTVTILIGICGLESVKKQPHKKSLLIWLDLAMVFTQTDPANTASMRPLHSLFKQRTLQGIVFQCSTSQTNKKEENILQK